MEGVAGKGVQSCLLVGGYPFQTGSVKLEETGLQTTPSSPSLLVGALPKC